MVISLVIKAYFQFQFNHWHSTSHPELSGCITTLTVRNAEVANFCAAMDTLKDQDEYKYIYVILMCNIFTHTNSPYIPKYFVMVRHVTFPLDIHLRGLLGQ